MRTGVGRDETPVRTVRVPEELWQRAQRKARRRNEQLSTVIRRALFAYVRDEPNL